MKIGITGASGFLGRHLMQRLAASGHQVEALARRPAHVAAEAVIHLAGEPVAQRWSPEAKARIRDSRVEGTRRLVGVLARESSRPQVLVSASAIGLYGPRGDEVLDETSAAGQGFLSSVATEWEDAARQAEGLGIRVVLLRIGILLGNGGALAKMLQPFRLGVGGRIGSGRQWMSWIHMEDAVNMVLFALENASFRGPVNATAPNPVTNLAFTRELAAALHRTAILPVPALALKMLFGEMAGLLLTGQRVVPKAALAAGFRFRFPQLAPALVDLLARHS